jgi:hypothetical protein
MIRITILQARSACAERYLRVEVRCHNGEGSRGVIMRNFNALTGLVHCAVLPDP